MIAAIGRASQLRYGGLEQFPDARSHGGVDYCIAGSKPYALEFANGSDVICLLLGDIFSKTRFEDDTRGAAGLPGRDGGIPSATWQCARRRQFGPPRLRRLCLFGRVPGGDQRPQPAARRARPAAPTTSARSRSAISPAMRASASGCGARSIRWRSSISAAWSISRPCKACASVRPVNRAGLSDGEFARISAFIDAELEGDISCARIARAVDLPLRVHLRRHEGADRPVALSVRAGAAGRQGAGSADPFRSVDRGDRLPLRLRLAAASDGDVVEEAREYAAPAAVQLGSFRRRAEADQPSTWVSAMISVKVMQAMKIGSVPKSLSMTRTPLVQTTRRTAPGSAACQWRRYAFAVPAEAMSAGSHGHDRSTDFS